ncbi:MAG: hypothetical protein RLY30_559 [Pseudomonadota bacterium]
MRAALILALTLTLAACSTPSIVKDAADWVLPKGEKLQWKALRLQPQPNANQNSPIALDLVLALDQVTADKLETLTGTQWHLQREGLLNGLQGMVAIQKFELTPGDGIQVLEDELPKARALHAYVFANLKGEAVGRLRISTRPKQVVIEVGETELHLRTDPPLRP